MSNINAIGSSDRYHDAGGKGTVQAETKNENSIFSSYDSDTNNKISAEEMGFKKTLDNILKNLPTNVASSIVAKTVNNIKNLVEGLKTDITYGATPEDIDVVKKEVEARKRDVENLVDIAEDLKNKNDAELAAKNFETMFLKSDAAINALGEDHNKNIEEMLGQKAEALAMANVENQAKEYLVKFNEAFSANPTAFSYKDVPIETIKGFEITDVVIDEKFKGITGTENDERVEDGILRRADSLRIKMQYTYNGKTYTVAQEISTPAGYQTNELINGRGVNITEGDGEFLWE